LNEVVTGGIGTGSFCDLWGGHFVCSLLLDLVVDGVDSAKQ
jgi:hypothetical protein